MFEQEKNKKSYPNLEKLNMDQLQDLLRQDYESSDDDEMDMEYISAIIEVIKKRNLESDEPVQFDVKADWKAFKEKYILTEPTQIISITQPSSKKRARSKWKIWQTVAAVLVVTVLLGTFTAQAFGYNLFRIIAQWTDEIFTLRNPVEDTSTQSDLVELPQDMLFESIQEVLDKLNITVNAVPKWYPEGFTQTQMVIAQQLPERILIDAVFENADRLISISLTIYNEIPDDVLAYYMKDDTPVVEYEIWGVTHYIMSNFDKNIVVWMNDNVEVSIQGDITEDELLLMVKSIYGG